MSCIWFWYDLCTGDCLIEAYTGLLLAVPLSRKLIAYTSLRCFEFLITKPSSVLYAYWLLCNMYMERHIINYSSFLPLIVYPGSWVDFVVDSTNKWHFSMLNPRSLPTVQLYISFMSYHGPHLFHCLFRYKALHRLCIKDIVNVLIW
jgi:hypothetical protein